LSILDKCQQDTIYVYKLSLLTSVRQLQVKFKYDVIAGKQTAFANTQHESASRGSVG